MANQPGVGGSSWSGCNAAIWGGRGGGPLRGREGGRETADRGGQKVWEELNWGDARWDWEKWKNSCSCVESLLHPQVTQPTMLPPQRGGRREPGPWALPRCRPCPRVMGRCIERRQKRGKFGDSPTRGKHQEMGRDDSTRTTPSSQSPADDGHPRRKTPAILDARHHDPRHGRAPTTSPQQQPGHERQLLRGQLVRPLAQVGGPGHLTCAALLRRRRVPVRLVIAGGWRSQRAAGSGQR